VLRAKKIGKAGGDFKTVEIRSARQAAHDGDHLKIRAFEGGNKAGGDVERAAP
jgi:hypothetical protein